ncbi:Fic family protein [Sanguibacter sp. Leaf3]|uniref:Fic family protein n=1 Tax=Sanguibacter sp. Leaf3 TaxID=1736209 RepID=UPI0007006D6E|nr:Fic family protein [Sanguibacter sp. Leaf3]KQT99560.1 cell filamentation protein Fic [Sanguibacter sp. Leaf3]
MTTAPTTEPLRVPPVGHDEHSWVADSDGLSTRAQVRAGSGTYLSTTPALIADLVLTLPGDLSSDVDEATAALSRLDSHASSTLGPQSAELGPMSSILLRTESASSSQIENLTVGARQLALAEIDQGGSTNARTVVANVRAMEAALDLADSLDQQAVLTMHKVLLSGQRGAEQHAGRYRDSLVWVGKSGISPLGAEHVAPQAELVEAAMADLMAFVDRDDLPALVQTAVAHAQLETIHPFADGNGRTGRALIHAMLRAKGITRTVTAPVSAGLLTDTASYFEALTAFRGGDARPIVEQLARASRYAARTGAQLVDDLAAEVASSRAMLGSLRPHAAAWRLLPHLVAHPVVNASLVERLLATNAVTAQRALTQLTDAGVLHERTGRRRNRVWQHDGVLTVLDLFAQGIRWR